MAEAHRMEVLYLKTNCFQKMDDLQDNVRLLLHVLALQLLDLWRRLILFKMLVASTWKCLKCIDSL